MPAGPVVATLFIWTGALLFFVSLAYFLFSYFTAFGAPATGGTIVSAVTWNVTLFTAFALHHSLFARLGVRRFVATVLPAELERPVYVWIASLLFIVLCASWTPVPGLAWQADGAALWTLRGLQAAGLWLSVRSAAALDIRELAGLRPQGPAPRPEFKTSGPYGWVRHPIYSGWFLMVLAASPMTMTRLVFAIVSCVYLLVAIPWEEQSMRAASPGAYDRYTAQVRWRLLPGIFGWWFVVSGSWLVVRSW